MRTNTLTMKRVFPVLLLVSLLTPLSPAEALTCRQVAELNEELRIASIRNPKFGLNTRKSIKFTVKVYQANYQNPSCVTSKQVTDVVSVVQAIQSACKVRRISEPGYKDWKKFERDFWASTYGRNFKYACSLWNKFRF